ncbi:hypothetical protein [Priestia megaterium]|uniref:hypothetical protein n=1 Tax=Priestia megaterium TaxID=1404 RepID=UPI000BFE6DB6|nr:hypothetical protein [Priestia megaterium]PGQ88219.1 hypothetical protein COA18_04650 [Priestia megaterium]
MVKKFERMKQIVEQAKETKMREEAKMAQLSEERIRIFKELQEETGQPISSLEEAEAISDKLKESIESDILEMARILVEEGYEV